MYNGAFSSTIEVVYLGMLLLGINRYEVHKKPVVQDIQGKRSRIVYVLVLQKHTTCKYRYKINNFRIYLNLVIIYLFIPSRTE